MADKYNCKFVSKASDDLDDLLEYIKHRLSNPKAANDLAVELFEKIETIKKFPQSGKKVDNEFILDQELRKFFVGNYIVFYKPDSKMKLITIIRIVYGGRNIDEMIKML